MLTPISGSDRMETRDYMLDMLNQIAVLAKKNGDTTLTILLKATIAVCRTSDDADAGRRDSGWSTGSTQ